MSIFDNILQRFGYYNRKALQRIPAFASNIAGDFVPWQADYGVMENQNDLYTKLSWLAQAIDITADYAALTTLSVKQRVDDEEDDITNHPFEVLLESPNPLQGKYELLSEFFHYRKLLGNGYLWLNRASANEPPLEIWSLPAHMVSPKPNGRQYIEGYLFTSNAEEIMIPPFQVVHSKSFNPKNPFVGLSPVEQLAIVASGNLGMQKWNTNTFTKASGTLPGILAFADPVPPGEWDLIKADVKESSRIRNMLMLRGAGKGGVQWLQNTATQRDMEFIAGRNFNREEIFGMVAPGLYTMLSENSTEANSKTGKSAWIEFAVWPLLVALHSQLTRLVLPAYGKGLVAEFDDIRVTDRTLELAEQTEYSRTHTINEIRSKFYGDDGLEPERGDILPAEVGVSTITNPDDEIARIEAEQARIEAQPEVVPNEEPEVEDVEEVEDEAAQAVKAELEKWRRKATKAVKKGDPANVTFTSTIIPLDMRETITARLDNAKSTADISTIFDNVAHTSFSSAKTLYSTVETFTPDFSEIVTALRDAAKSVMMIPEGDTA